MNRSSPHSAALRGMLRSRVRALVSGICGGLDRHMAEIVRGAAAAFVLKVAGAAAVFAFHLLLARAYGARGAGIYFLALTLVTVAAVLGRVGLDNALLRHIASNASAGDWESTKGVYSLGMRMALAASGVAALALVAGAPWLSGTVFSKPELAGPLRGMALAVVPLALLTLHGQALQGLKRIPQGVAVLGVWTPLLAIGGLLLIPRERGVEGATWAYVGATVATLLVGAAHWRRATAEARAVAGRFDRGRLLRSSAPLYGVATLQLVIGWSATLLLGAWAGAGEVGIFVAANRTAMLTSFILMSVNSIAAPKFAALHREGDLEALGSTARSSARLMTVIGSPILLIFLVAPRSVLGLFGPEFRDGGTVLAILAAGQFVNVVTGSVGYLLMMCGHEKLMKNTLLAGAATNLVLGVVLIPRFGMIGAAWCTAITVAMQNLIAAALVWRRLHIVTLPSFPRR